MSELMTVRQAAQKLRLSEITIRRHIKEGRLPAFKLGRAVRLGSEDIESFVLSRKMKAH